MYQVISKKLKTTIGGGAVIIAALSIISRFLGLIRDRLLASHFGAGDILDVYFAAFKLPDLIFNTLVLGALSAAFIPVFVQLWQAETERHKAWQLASGIINILTLVLIILGVVCFFGASQLMVIIAPGFSQEKIELTVKLTRIMLLSIIFFGISNVFSGVLNSLKKFAVFSLAPIMYNLGIIFGIIFLVKPLGIIGLAWGVVLGAFFHLMIQVPPIMAAGFFWSRHFNWHLPEVKQVIKLMLPRTVALGINQINQIVITIIASTLAAGSLAIFNFAFNLQSFPIGIFAISIALAAFPAFSESYSAGDQEGYMIQFSVATRRVLYLIIPLSAIIILLRAQIVRVTLGAGNFDWTDTILTADSLGFFCLSLFAQGVQPIFTRAFYARHDTKTPFFISLITLILNLILSLFLTKKFGVEGLALAFSIASIINVLLLFIILRQRAGYLDEKQILASVIKISLATLVAALVTQIAKPFFSFFVDMTTFWGVLIQGLFAGGLGLLTYVILTYYLKSPEIEVFKKFFLPKK